MTTALVLLAILGALGAFDTVYYHEWKLRLPSRPHARLELTLHASRDFAYAILFAMIGWLTWDGALAWLLLGLLLLEIVVTLWDFIEEDRTRVPPLGSERCTRSWGSSTVSSWLISGRRSGPGPTIRPATLPRTTARSRGCSRPWRPACCFPASEI